MTFEDIIAPTTVDEFRRKYLGKHYLRNGGATSRFAQLLPWDGLNRAIADLEIARRRVRLVRNGKPVDPAEYSDIADMHFGPRVNARGLERRLSLGDSLQLVGVHDMFPEIRALTISVQLAVGGIVGANVYAGFRKQTKALDLHWDDHDALILQIDGVKAWTLYAPTVLYPISSQRPQDVVKPTVPPIWAGLLRAGDLLYMPKGWWHVAEPVDGASLHVTFGMYQPTGLDLMAWVTEELKESVVARRHLPIYWSHAEQVAAMEQLASEVTKRLTLEGLQQYVCWAESPRPEREVPRLPSAVVRNCPRNASTPLVLADRRRLYLIPVSDGETSFWSLGKLWRCDVALKPAIDRLSDLHGLSLTELQQCVPEDVRSKLATFIDLLVYSGVVSAQHDGATGS